MEFIHTKRDESRDSAYSVHSQYSFDTCSNPRFHESDNRHHTQPYGTHDHIADPGVRITNIGLALNMVMAMAKFVGGWHFNSSSLVADAWHSVTDLASDLLTLATVHWSSKQPTKQFPLGFGRVESLGSLGVSIILLAGGLYMGWETILSLTHHVFQGHSNSAVSVPDIHATWIALATIASKEWLYYATMNVAREQQSPVLESNAIHHRADSLTAIVALLSIIGANMVEKVDWMDLVGGLLISLMVIHAGAKISITAVFEIVGGSIDDDMKQEIQLEVHNVMMMTHINHEAELHYVGGFRSGPCYTIGVEMAVPDSWSISYVREIEEEIGHHVGRRLSGIKVVHVRFISKGDAVNPRREGFAVE